MKISTKILSLTTAFLLTSCGGPTYKLISTGVDNSNYTSFNIKHVLDGCCGCSGILVNTFQADKLTGQLFIESNEGCPFTWTKYNFHYSGAGSFLGVDTLVAVDDSSFIYPITDIDKIALTKIDSFIAVQSSSYRVRKIDIKGYRHKTSEDKLTILPPRTNKQALH